MKNSSILILALGLFIALPSYANPIYEKNNFMKMRERFQKIDTNGDGLLSKDEMMSAQSDRIDKIFINSGFEWREPGCSMCLAMNADKLKPGERCASTSNRNFEGRQGRGGRTHLVSPGMAAAAAISGNLDDVRKYQN